MTLTTSRLIQLTTLRELEQTVQKQIDETKMAMAEASVNQKYQAAYELWLQNTGRKGVLIDIQEMIKKLEGE